MSLIPRHLIASTLVVALTAATSPTFAAPAAATLTGTVYGDDVKTPFEGATVVVTDVNGVKTRLPADRGRRRIHDQEHRAGTQRALARNQGRLVRRLDPGHAGAGRAARRAPGPQVRRRCVRRRLQRESGR